MRTHAPYQSQRVYQNLVLAAVDLLVPIKANSFTSIAALEAVRVNNQSTRGHFTPLFSSYSLVQSVRDLHKETRF